MPRASKTKTGSEAEAAGGMTFAEFGEEFINLAVTEEVIEQNLAAAMPKELPIDNPNPKVTGKARVSLGQVTRARSADGTRTLVFDVTINLQMTLYVDIKVGQENYEIAAEVPLRLAAGVRRPLAVVIDARPVKAEDVRLVTEGRGNWFNIAKGELEQQLKSRIAAEINGKIADSAKMRTIDVLSKIRESMKPGAGGAAPGGAGGKPEDGAQLLRRGGEIVSTLDGGSHTRVMLPEGDTDMFEFTLYLKKKSEKDPDGVIAVDFLDADGGLLARGEYDAMASGDDWDRERINLWSHEIADVPQVIVRLTNVKQGKGKTPTIQIKLKAE